MLISRKMLKFFWKSWKFQLIECQNSWSKKDFALFWSRQQKLISIQQVVLVVADTSVCMRNGSAFRRRNDLSPDVFRAQFLEIFCHFEHFPRNEHSDFSSHVVGGIKKAGRRLFFFTASALMTVMFLVEKNRCTEISSAQKKIDKHPKPAAKVWNLWKRPILKFGMLKNENRLFFMQRNNHKIFLIKQWHSELFFQEYQNINRHYVQDAETRRMENRLENILISQFHFRHALYEGNNSRRAVRSGQTRWGCMSRNEAGNSN